MVADMFATSQVSPRKLLGRANSPRLLIELNGEDTAEEVRELLEAEGYVFYTVGLRRVDCQEIPPHVLAFCGRVDE